MTVLSVGIDVAKATLAVAYAHGAGGRQVGEFPNTPAGFEQLAERLNLLAAQEGAEAIRMTLEPTAGYELGLAYFGVEQGWAVNMPSPEKVRKWAYSQGRRAKTDALDARVLAQYGAAPPLSLWRPMSVEASELESLQERHRELEGLIQQEHNRLEAWSTRRHVAEAVHSSHQAVLRALEEERDRIAAAIAEHLQQHTALREGVQRLRSVPGIGAKNSVPLLLFLQRFAARTGGQGDAKALVAYVGLDPRTHTSGSSVRGHTGISRMGDRHLRRLLYMGALGGVKGNNPLRAFYQQLVGRGKAKKAALVAAARKILIWAWAVFRRQTAFDPHHPGLLATISP